jgi:lysophospholipase L1-like esterase
LPEDPTSLWDFSKYQPHVVVVNLGTNDNAGGDPGAPFTAAYTQLLEALRGHYPSARIYGAVGTMLGGADYDRIKGYVQTALTARGATGDDNLALLELGSQVSTDGLGCDYHPSLKTHELMAAKLEAALRTDLGW